ncbi:MAG: hypothetical protein ACTSRZ_06900 [Promethearchaeota archaeon]
MSKINDKITEKKTNKDLKFKFKEIYKFSKIVHNELVLEGILTSAGSQKERYLQSLKKNKRSVKTNAIMMKVLSAVFIALISLTQIMVLKQIISIRSFITAENFHPLLFSASIPIILLYGSYFIFFFTYGMTSTIGVFTGTSYRFLYTLPISKKEIKKIVFLSFIKTIDYQFIAMVLSFPIITYYFIREISVLIISIISTFINAIFCISLMIIISNFMAKKIFKIEDISRSQTVLRVVVSVLYMITAMLIGISFSFLTSFLSELFSKTMIIGESGALINNIISFIFWPFSLAYIYGLGLMPIDILAANFSQYWIILLGILVGILIIFTIARKSLNILATVLREESIKTKKRKIWKRIKPSKEEEHDSLKMDDMQLSQIRPKAEPYKPNITTPKNAIIRKDLKYFSRDFQAIIYLIMPIILSLVGLFIGFSEKESSTPGDLSAFIVAIMVNILYLGMSIIFLIVAVTSAENDTGNLLYSLPLSNKIIFKAKRKLIYYIMIFPVIINIIIAITLAKEILMSISYILYFILISYDLINIGLCLYGVFFGKLRDRYYLQMINLRRKALKAFLGGAIIIIMVLAPFIIVAVLVDKGIFNDLGGFLMLLLFSIAFFFIAVYLQKKIFKIKHGIII